jgi:hypothetical protein
VRIHEEWQRRCVDGVKAVQAVAASAALARVRVQPAAISRDCAAPVLPVKPAWPCSRRAFLAGFQKNSARASGRVALSWGTEWRRLSLNDAPANGGGAHGGCSRRISCALLSRVCARASSKRFPGCARALRTPHPWRRHEAWRWRGRLSMRRRVYRVCGGRVADGLCFHGRRADGAAV